MSVVGGLDTTTPLTEPDWSFVSPGVVTLKDNPLSYRKGALVRDRDGHALLLTEP
jgi:hypothetical protein